MKKWLACGFVVLALSLFLCGAALAADAEGIQSPSISADGITAEVNASNRDILNLTYSGAAAGKEYVVFATSTDAAPTESNLVYIDRRFQRRCHLRHLSEVSDQRSDVLYLAVQRRRKRRWSRAGCESGQLRVLHGEAGLYAGRCEPGRQHYCFRCALCP